MVMFITIEVPEELAQELEPYRERLVELLERGLRTAEIDDADRGSGVDRIIGLLATRPTTFLKEREIAKFCESWFSVTASQ